MGLNDGTYSMHFNIPAEDFLTAGEASSTVKRTLSQLGVNPVVIKKVAVSMYEAEINAVIHAGGGQAEVDIDNATVVVKIKDNGPGISDVELAMKEGFSTAPDYIREMGFGAGMGLPNMKRYADKLDINTEIGKGTEVVITVYLNK